MSATQLAFPGVVDTAPFSPGALWQTLPMVSIDTETTGPDPATARIVEVAAIRFAKGVKPERWSSPIDPGCEIPAEASAIHGWTNASLAECKAPKLGDYDHDMVEPMTGEVLTHAHGLIERMSGRVLVGYCACRYDIPILERELSAATRAPVVLGPTIDVLTWIKKLDRFVSGEGRHKLGVTARRHGIALPSELHRAEADAYLTIQLLGKIRAELPETLGELVTTQAQLAREQEADFRAWRARQDAMSDDAKGIQS